ncbi:olfactory receptor 7G1-like [Elephas maximus indicus]|uniref:olfactory receptor 7G1-like n=1 Tax=Elephas maximus indicus TaxID=99487 RepID=UPI002116069D|nr:olfactory receptor 7G1-like [Elephas maximus indicus]XP_049731317.1 olfactory receptor 7G1-like [Elephas maximus indicus]
MDMLLVVLKKAAMQLEKDGVPTCARFIDNMEPRNQRGVSEFLLLALTDDPEVQPFLFSLFLSIYLVTVLGNLLITLAVSSDPHLHTPIITTIPKMLVNLQAQNQSITYAGCLTRVCFVMIFASTENFLLGVMAYDRYVAICHPLRYMVIMDSCFCGLLILVSLLVSIVDALLNSLMLLRLSFCTDLETLYLFCEVFQVVKIAFSEILINNIILYFAASILGVLPFSGIIFSYTQIVSSILRMPSAGGQYKAFSTCGSHLSVVSLFYGTAFGAYVSMTFTHSSWKTAVASVVYTVVTPMMNPFIYSLRNRDVKGAMRNLIRCTIAFQ